MTRYEYMLHTVATSEQPGEHVRVINKMGKEGWELTAAVHPEHSSYIWYYFKRIKGHG